MRIISFLLLFLILSPPSHACSPGGQADPWFLYTVEIDQSTLPSGVELISKTFSGSKPWQENQLQYFITNKSSTPVYLFEDSGYPSHFDPKDKSLYGDAYIFPNSEIPEEFKPKFKLQDSVVYFYGQTNSKDPRGYIPNCQKRSDCYSLLDFDTVYPNIHEAVIYQDHRPEEVTIPESKEFSIDFFHEGNPHTIKGTIRFALNRDYDPTILARTFQQGVEACNKWQENINKPWYKKIFD